MKILLLVLVCGDVLATAAAQSHCDPITQYETNGQCCQMCGPGTSMWQNTCLDPQCTPCGDSEYQDKYTTETKCRRQPYCDPNKNFQPSIQHSKSIRTTCLCFLGFHCSTRSCITCVPHTACKPGEGAVSIGNQTHDTVCAKCREGSFSANDSWDGVCTKWTECQSGFQVQQKGSSTSDTACEETSRQHTVLIVLLSIIGCVIVGGLVLLKVCRKKTDKPSLDPNHEKHYNPLICTPQDDVESYPIEWPSSQEEVSPKTPEENIEDESTEDTLSSGLTTRNGNYVTQETGKAEIQPQQESQTLTLTN